ncbi:HAMP domain-containing sensor histidine kinase [Streptococcus plurextorum]|uniref:HAMP domain-containing sensor histidine kinase n=1 Tax=Streptococcus plurextorum TaxID=456876 RepID=UPI000428C191|nr:HAMP domain-containing sensor histidine kinase [Streptococcus plurextorum]
MNLQKRIFRLNIVMLALSLVAMLGISVFVANNMYQNRGNWQSISQATEISQKALENFRGTNFVELADQLSSSDARLYVAENGQLVYSNLDDDTDDVTSVSISQEAHMSYVDEEIIISRELTADNNRTYQLYVVIDNDEERRDGEEFQSFLIQLATIGGIGIILILCFNWFFTRRILQVIMHPLEELHGGVDRIQEGNYQLPLIYQGDREFEELIAGFNQMQQSLRESQQQNRLYEQNRRQMVADISHDLRTPLTSIKGYAKGILDGVAKTEAKQKDYLTIIYQKSIVMEKLLEKLFVFSQLETDRIPFDFQIVNLSQLLEAYASEKLAELSEKGIHFKLNLPDSLWTEVDLVQFRRILDNLVDNAQKYAGVNPLVLSFTGAVKENNIIWTFSDNGRGVPEEQLPDIFNEFYRVDDTRQKTEGHGLGLSIIKNITTRFGGTVTVENKDGLHFTFVLPRKEVL